MAHRIPVLRSLLIAVQAWPQMQDCTFFLIWRSYSAASQSLIKWEDLRHQFWQADSNLARIRQRFKEAIALIRTAWPELQARSYACGFAHCLTQTWHPIHPAVPASKSTSLHERKAESDRNISQAVFICLEKRTHLVEALSISPLSLSVDILVS